MNAASFEPRVRTYGRHGPDVIVLHGGPAAIGDAEPTARALSKRFRVHEPFQRGRGDEPLTVAIHVADLDTVVASVSDDCRPSLVGQSWGAMLALAYAAEHPASISALVLVGCGTFDQESRDRMNETINSRLDDRTRHKLDSLDSDYPDATERLFARYELTRPAYTFDAIPSDDQLSLSEPFDVRAHTETWNDMIRQQEKGVYPAAFSRIAAPVLMLHGDYDPHPGGSIYSTLKAFIPQLEYHELVNCGHAPWTERRARKEYFGVMTNWLLSHSDRSSG
jgi:pimeloyl-ACP methyl ester carboxylesterase